MKIPLFIHKILHFEYWPLKVFYLPMIPVWIYLGLKTRSLTFFTNINPLMEFSGMFGASKQGILEQVSPQYRPVSVLVSEQNLNEKHIIELMSIHQLDFPIILKPNVGERGVNVQKINSVQELISYLSDNQDTIILQEFVTSPIELGVFYVRMPNESKGKVTSVTLREFLTVTGNGQNSIAELMQQNTRARFQLERIKTKLGEGINEVLPKGENRLLEPIGNHNRGTKFINANHLINSQLNEIFDNISLPIDGFFYGRYDLKVSSYEDLYAGKNIKILELNGTNSEPGHIYDPHNSIFKAYKDLAWQWNIMANISIQQRKKGILPIGAKAVLETLLG